MVKQLSLEYRVQANKRHFIYFFKQRLSFFEETRNILACGRMWFWIGFATAFVIMTIFIFYPWPKKYGDAAVGPFQLQLSKEVADTKASQTILTGSNTGSLQAFIYPVPYQRTGQLSMCSDGSSPQPGEPDCNSGRFGICACEGTDCSKCKHVGYVNILNISNVVRLEMLNSPDASRQNAALVQLVVRTLRKKYSGNDSQVIEETLALPSIPLQRWTMITIAREGRRYDIYYNAQLVSSKRTEHVLDINSAVAPVVAGDPNLWGSVALVQVFAERLTARQVSLNYSKLADTNGQPYLPDATINLADSLSFCKGGECLKAVNVRPTSPLLDWDTQYA